MQYKSVLTLNGTHYRVGDEIEKGTVSDITIEANWGEHLAITVCVRPTPGAGETIAVIIPYHAVELLVK